MPWLVALREDRRLPALVRGPVDRRAFFRFAFTRRDVDVRVPMADAPFPKRRYDPEKTLAPSGQRHRLGRTSDAVDTTLEASKKCGNRPFSAGFTLLRPTAGRARC